MRACGRTACNRRLERILSDFFSSITLLILILSSDDTESRVRGYPSSKIMEQKMKLGKMLVAAASAARIIAMSHRRKCVSRHAQPVRIRSQSAACRSSNRIRSNHYSR